MCRIKTCCIIIFSLTVFAQVCLAKDIIWDFPDTQSPIPDNRKKISWIFDAGFDDTENEFTFMTSGNPRIEPMAARYGSGGVFVDGKSHLVMYSDPFFYSGEMSFSFWIKTTGSEQKEASMPVNIISFDGGYFNLAINKGQLSFQKAGRIWENIATWTHNSWQHIALVAARNVVTCYINGKKAGEILSVPAVNRSGNLLIGLNGLTACIDDLNLYNYTLTEKEISEQGFILSGVVSAWTFENGLDGWREIEDGSIRDITVEYEPGAMILHYVDNASEMGPQLWFPQVEVNTKFDAELYPFCDIFYQAIDWPIDIPVKGLLEFGKSDGTIAYSFFDIDPGKNYVRVDISATDPGWGTDYSGEIGLIRIEIPHNSSATPAEKWFGASTKITKIELLPEQRTASEAWNSVLQSSAFVKSGMDKLARKDYQYQPLGLGGTVLRVDPWGFAGTKAPDADEGIWHKHRPYYGYEYWWDNEGHRFNPFILRGGYGPDLFPGTITSFEHQLNIATGELTIDLGLKVEGTSFMTKRTVFVTPEGVLVIRIQDTGAPSPIRLNVAVEQDVRIYNNSGIYDKLHESWTSDITVREQSGTKGMVITATRLNTSTAVLAVVAEATSSVITDSGSATLNSSNAADAITFYIIPASSFNPETPDLQWDHAWNKAFAARQKGYETLKQETAVWWNDYMNRSQISIPDESIAKLYAQSVFYHGIYFGNTSIPPGCNSTDVESFAGAICPEYDLMFSHLALLYTGHLNEAKHIADWTYNVLPKAKENAVNGITHHHVTRKYLSGAIYTTLMGYDGTICVQPTEGEGINLYQNYPGTNAALMALSYLDYSDDQLFCDKAYDILKSTTYVSLQDLIVDGNAYRCKHMPNTVQQSAVRMGYNECKKRGLSEPGWDVFEDKILIPQTTLFGEVQIAGGVGALAEEGVGDATWLSPLWWYGVITKDDRKILPTYINVSKSSTGNYVFNNGTMGVIAAKLGMGNDALSWLQNFTQPDILYDDVCFSEVRGNHALTPEIGAHGAFICNVSQMLIDPDDDQNIDLFPAIPDEWEYRNIGFNDLMVKGGLSVSAVRDLQHVKVEIKNNSSNILQRDLKIKIPRMFDIAGIHSSELENGFIVVQLTILPGEIQSYEYQFTPTDITSNVEIGQNCNEGNRLKIFPNPNSTGMMHVLNGEDICEICIYTLSGKMTTRFQGGSDVYPVYGLENGNYVVLIKTKDNKYIQQMLIVKR
ncbi:MAG: T9SS type A sorting domain-containing protein [Tannerella sp.]|jgi:hypothetical protein|nr:T9SS type A sorting domain-containing protein [Tannerella sp.]